MMASRPVLASGEECEVHRMGPGFKEIMDEESDLCVSDWELFCKNFYFFSEVFDFLVKVVGRSSPPASCSPSNPSLWISGLDGNGARCGCACGSAESLHPAAKWTGTANKSPSAEFLRRRSGRTALLCAAATEEHDGRARAPSIRRARAGGTIDMCDYIPSAQPPNFVLHRYPYHNPSFQTTQITTTNQNCGHGIKILLHDTVEVAHLGAQFLFCPTTRVFFPKTHVSLDIKQTPYPYACT